MEISLHGHKEEIESLLRVPVEQLKSRVGVNLKIENTNTTLWVNQIDWVSSSMTVTKLSIHGYLENQDKKELKEAKRKVQQAQKDFKKAQRELSKLQEKMK